MHLLVLAGTHEAHLLAAKLKGVADVSVTVSLARAETPPRAFDWPVRKGGFGGEDGFRDWVLTNSVDAIMDATHPFAEKMPFRTARVARFLDIPHVRFLRPGWLPDPDDQWSFLESASDAARVIPPDATIFLATGRRDLDRMTNLAGRRILCRVRSEPRMDFPFPGGRFLFQPGPFTVASETEFLRGEGVDWIIARNSGGQGAWPKLEAARHLGIPVALIRRPRQPECDRISNMSEALDWVRRKL